MAIGTAAVTFDIADQLGNDFDPRRTKVWITTNIPGDTVIDKAGNKIRLGSGNVTLNADGTGSMLVWVPGSDANPSSWQTTVHVDYPDRNASKGRTTKSFGPFTITTNADLADLVAEMPVQPEYLATVLETVQDMIDEATGSTGPALAALADRLDGVNDHGDVSGTLLLNPAKGFHVFDATGATTVELGTPPGNSLAFKAITGADQVEVDGLPDLDLTDNAWATFVYYRGAWDLAAAGAGGGGSVEPVTDPPTQPGVITVDPTSSGYNLSWVASTIAAGYEGQVDGGSYVDYGSNLTEALTGYSPGSSHSGGIRAYNSLGQRSSARTWGPASVDTVGFHEQLLALEPALYARLSRGSIEEFGSSTGTWTNNGGVPFNGPAMMSGETGSAVFAPNKNLKRTAGTEFNNVEKISFIMLMSTAPSEDGSPRVVSITSLGRAPVNGGQTYYDTYDNEHLFVITIDRSAGQNLRVSYRDGVLREMTTAPEWSVGTIGEDGVIFNGWPFGGQDGTFKLSHVAVVTGEILTQSQAQALAVAAGTFGNSA